MDNTRALDYFIDNNFEITFKRVGNTVAMVVSKGDLYSAWTLDDDIAQAFLTGFVTPAISSLAKELDKLNTV